MSIQDVLIADTYVIIIFISKGRLCTYTVTAEQIMEAMKKHENE